MDLCFVDADTPDFDSRTYLHILVSIAKADKENGGPEYAFVRRQAQRLGLDCDHFLKTTDRQFCIDKQKVSRTTALVLLKDALMLASMDRNLTLPEKQRIYAYAANLDVSRKDVDALEMLIDDHRRLDERWRRLVRSF